jgi:hypothetical protein
MAFAGKWSVRFFWYIPDFSKKGLRWLLRCAHNS